MSELDDALSRILSSPESMEKIASLAASLSQPEDARVGEAGTPAPEGGADMGRMAALLSAVSGDDSAADLLRALKPFLSPERSRKVDAAVNAARIARAAKLILSNGGIESAGG